MATFYTSGYVTYDLQSGTLYEFGEVNTGPIVLNDGEGDATFEYLDDLNPGSTTNQYIGQIDVPLSAGGTITLPVVNSGNTGFETSIFLMIPQGLSESDIIAPASIDSAALDTSDFLACFATGTLIATSDGERTVETLAPGDMVLAADGRAVRLTDVLHRPLATSGLDLRNRLVRIRRDAIAPGVPHTDLVVTGDHGMILDGLVVNASALVNGGTIDWVSQADLPSYPAVYHLETATHEALLANGAQAESFVGTRTRNDFDSRAAVSGQPAPQRIVPEMPLPRIASARLLPLSLRDRLGLSEDRTVPLAC